MATARRKPKNNETEQEAFEKLLKEFNRQVQNEKIIKETRDRMYYTKPSERRRKYKLNLRKKYKRKLRQQERYYNGL